MDQNVTVHVKNFLMSNKFLHCVLQCNIAYVHGWDIIALVSVLFRKPAVDSD